MGQRMFENSEIEVLEILKNQHSLRIAHQRMMPNKATTATATNIGA